MGPPKTPKVSKEPLVSVVVPSYNAQNTIRETLRSILRQTYSHMEVIVVDDGSTDKTGEIVRSMARMDDRLRLLHQKNAGVAAARNRGIEAAKGKFIAPIDADDIWFSRNLEKQVDRMLRIDDPVDVVYSWSLEIDQNGRLSGGFHSARFEGMVFFALLQAFFMGHASATLIRGKCFEKLGGYDSSLRNRNAEGCEDWDLYLRLAERYRFGVVPEFLIGYRQVPGNMGTRLNAMAASHDLVLKKVKDRRPDISNKWYRWSRGNFRLYLAMRSRENRQWKKGMDFILRGLLLDPPGTLLRHDTYLGALSFFFGPPLTGTPETEAKPSAIAKRVVLQRRLPIKQLQQYRLRPIEDLRRATRFKKTGAR